MVVSMVTIVKVGFEKWDILPDDSGSRENLKPSTEIGIQGTIGLQGMHSEFCPYSEVSFHHASGGSSTTGVHCSEACPCEFKRPPRPQLYKGDGCSCKLCKGEK